ncbi:TPA: hypothetical protein HJP37_004594 [Escherichia coli]|nr:hypothetical protein [Escherichia coli]
MKGQTTKDFIMTMPDLCALLQRSRWGTYKVMRRFPDFPKPENSGRGKMLIWIKSDVLAWYEIHKDELVKDGRGVKKCASQK